MQHYRKTRKKYLERKTSAQICPFCDPETLAKKVEDYAHAYVVPNLTKYDLWELNDVTEHLLLVPKRHVHSLGELTANERAETMDIIADYEAQGYNVYARSPDSVHRSVPHQHTHFIKIKHKPARGAIFLRKPYLLFTFR